ncbi:hypothetical protein GCM10023325_24180 [Sphingomonas lutea]
MAGGRARIPPRQRVEPQGITSKRMGGVDINDRAEMTCRFVRPARLTRLDGRAEMLVH